MPHVSFDVLVSDALHYLRAELAKDIIAPPASQVSVVNCPDCGAPELVAAFGSFKVAIPLDDKGVTAWTQALAAQRP